MADNKPPFLQTTMPASSKICKTDLKQSFFDLNFRSDIGCECFKNVGYFKDLIFGSHFKSEILFFLVISDLKNSIPNLISDLKFNFFRIFRT